MSKIIDRYEIHHADELEALDLAEKTRNYLPLKELLEIVQRLAQRHFYLPLLLMKNTFFFSFLLANYEYSKLEESNVDNASVDTLISLEEQLETALSVTRARKTELMMGEVKSLQKTENLLREENQTLASQVGKKTFLVIEGDRGMSWENGSGNKVRETLPLLK
jgi:cell division protein FtsB